jgi:hypothetical protein
MAAKFPEIQFTETTPGVVRQPRASLDVSTGQEEISRGLMQLGGALEGIADNIYKQESAAEFSELKRQVDERGFAAFNSVTGDDEDDAKLWENFQTDLGTLQSKKPNVTAGLQRHVNNVMPNWQDSFNKKHLAVQQKNASAKFNFEYNARLSKGDNGGAKEILDFQLLTQNISEPEYASRLSSLPNDSVLAQAYSMALDGNYVAADTKLNELTDPTTEQKVYRNKIASEARVQVKEAASEANKQLTDLLASKDLTIPEIQIRRDVLKDNDYESWIKIAMRPADKAGNVIQATGLKSNAMDVWRGTLTREELDNRTRASLADANGINDEQYASIVSAADTQLKQAQAEDIRRFSRDAANVILGQYSGLMQFDALGNLTGVNLAGLSGDDVEDAKFRMHYLSLYEQGLREWVADNPKASRKEFYEYSLDEKMRYWNTSLETMKALAKQPTRSVAEYKEGDVRTINGITYTFDGVKWND